MVWTTVPLHAVQSEAENKTGSKIFYRDLFIAGSNPLGRVEYLEGMFSNGIGAVDFACDPEDPAVPL